MIKQDFYLYIPSIANKKLTVAPLGTYIKNGFLHPNAGYS